MPGGGNMLKACGSCLKRARMRFCIAWRHDPHCLRQLLHAIMVPQDCFLQLAVAILRLRAIFWKLAVTKRSSRDWRYNIINSYSSLWPSWCCLLFDGGLAPTRTMHPGALTGCRFSFVSNLVPKCPNWNLKIRAVLPAALMNGLLRPATNSPTNLHIVWFSSSENACAKLAVGKNNMVPLVPFMKSWDTLMSCTVPCDLFAFFSGGPTFPSHRATRQGKWFTSMQASCCFVDSKRAKQLVWIVSFSFI